jgi:hypothetical protein
MANGTAALTDSDLLHDDHGPGFDSPAMKRAMAVPGSHRLPGGMLAEDAFAIDPSGQPYDVGAEFGELPPGPDDGEGMTDDEILSALEQEEADAVEFIGSTIAQDRADAMDYLFGRPFGNEEDNRSQAISTEVFDAVHALIPPIIKPFVSSDDVVAFEPESEQDAAGCEQETAYTIYTVMRLNDGFSLIYNWLFDGLAQKNGVVKYWWDARPESEIERYYGITADVLAMLLSAGDVEIIAGREYPAPQGSGPQPMPFLGGMQPPTLYDVTLRIRTEGKGFVRIENLPPEEFLISRDATSGRPKHARFCQHRRLGTISELREMGLDVDDDIASEGGGGDLSDITSSPEFMSRHEDDPLTGTVQPDTSGPNRQVLIRESYVRMDVDGDGIAELRKILVVGRTILINEETEEAPFESWTPYPIPHRYFGLCPADLSMDFQLQKSTVVRQMFDNIYGINNNRSAISRKVNWEDMLNNVVDGYVRVNAETVEGHIQPLAPQPIVGDLLPMVQYLDQQKENRLGNSRYNKGQDARAISKSPTATEVAAVTDSSQERTQLISRIFAETGFAPLMLSVQNMIRRHGQAQDTFRMRNKWVTIDPRAFKRRRNCTVSVGLGTGDKQQQLAFYQAFAGMMQQGMAMGLTDREKFYNLGRRLLELVGEKNTSLFLNDPANAPEPQPQKPESVQVQEAANAGLVQMETVKGQFAAQRTQMEQMTRYQIAREQTGAKMVEAGQEGQQHNDEMMLKWFSAALSALPQPMHGMPGRMQ